MTDGESRPDGWDLPPDATAMVDDYFERLRAAGLAGSLTAGAGVDRRRGDDGENVVADLRAHVRDRLHGTAGTPEDVTRVLSELGPPEALAAELASTVSEGTDDGQLAGGGSTRSSGSVLGIPYDLRAPTSARFASRWWNPLDRRILVPKAWGVGWVVNLGALAVLTGVVRPDDEDVPFATVPPKTVAATLMIPVVGLAVFAVFAAISWAYLPAIVPTHWGISGRVDGHGTRGSTLLYISLLAAAPVALATWVHARRQPPLNRVAASALSLAMVVQSIAVLAQTLFAVAGGTGVWPLWTGLACGLVLAFVLLVRVSHIGRTAEQRRDLSTGSTKGCV